MGNEKSDFNILLISQNCIRLNDVTRSVNIPLACFYFFLCLRSILKDSRMEQSFSWTRTLPSLPLLQSRRSIAVAKVNR